MKIFISLLFLTVYSSTNGQIINSDSHEIVFTGVGVIPMDKEIILPNQTIIISKGKIVAIGDAKKIKYSKGAHVIDAKGRYLIPALAEMHAHVPPGGDPDTIQELLLLFLTHGITTIRGMLGHPQHLELRDKLNSGQMLGPRLYTSGPSFNGNSVHSPGEADSMVRAEKSAGYDFLKIHPGLSLENFEALVKAAHEVNIAFAGHVPFEVGIWKACESGYATIDHLDGFVQGLIPDDKKPGEEEGGLFQIFAGDRADTAQIPKLIKALKEHHVWVVPTEGFVERWTTPSTTAETFVAEPDMKYMDRAVLEDWAKGKNDLMLTPGYDPVKMKTYIDLRKKLIYECNKNGVGLLLGCDAPQIFNVPGISTLHELKYMVDAGLTPYEALRTGTVNVASFLKRTDMGMVAPGAVSDLILLNGNPLEDITNIEKIEGVMIGNRWLSRSFIDESLKKIEKHNN